MRSSTVQQCYLYNTPLFIPPSSNIVFSPHFEDLNIEKGRFFYRTVSFPQRNVKNQRRNGEIEIETRRQCVNHVFLLNTGWRQHTCSYGRYNKNGITWVALYMYVIRHQRTLYVYDILAVSMYTQQLVQQLNPAKTRNEILRLVFQTQTQILD